MNEKVKILDIPIDILTMEQAIELIDSFIQGGGRKQIVTANAEIIFRAKNDSSLRRIIQQADLVTADGSGVVWAAKRLGRPLPERITGIDLMQNLMKLAVEKDYTVFLLGSKPGIAELAAENLKKAYPGLKLLGVQDGYFSVQEEKEIVARLKALAPNLLFVGLGSPKQEEWINRYIKELPGTVAMGVGGSFDVLSGQISRAPKWMQKAGLEWLYRLLKEPWRIRRMSALPKFMLKVLQEGKKY
ncbi:MAG TPA: WecB/TagA/CpsF family glycosyltransferase [Clostridia bacterium]|jgi:N-acetylglucosaminyldiphosphoundecaprenol N-acetyl-beta-D-mannosaminyltransferase|nr:WecB/TagA/CpsF family glycosyltransferase [Clostridia bacterium]